MQREETPNKTVFTDLSACPPTGRILAIDPGTKRVGIAVSDADRVIATPVAVIDRASWKKLLVTIKEYVSQFDAAAIVIGLPLDSYGLETDMTAEAADMARKLALSLEIPVFQQDERLTSYEAKGRRWERGKTTEKIDSEAASIILTDFLDRLKPEPSYDSFFAYPIKEKN